MFIKQLVPPFMKPLLRTQLERVGHAARQARGQHPLIPPPALHDVGDGSYIGTGKEFLGHFTKLAGLKPTDRVLDIGSGTGRMALPLTDFLTTGSYEGIDIVKESIDWCNKAYRRRAGFNFHHADIFNQKYNPGGLVAGRDYSFPFPDNSFDFVFLTSVFTHMLPDDIDRYLAEIKRVLAPGGTVLMTAFLLNEQTWALIGEQKARFTFAHPVGRYYANISHEPENATGYEEAEFRRMIHASGIEIAAVHYGSWRGVSGVSFQDIVICKSAS